MLAKAPSLAADEVIVDLEDAVAAEDKEQARGLAVAALGRGPLGRTTALRVNGRSTPWWEDDLRAAAEARPDVVVLPKVESPEDVSAAAELLPDGIGLEAQIETARGLVEADRIAAAGARARGARLRPGGLAASLGVPVLTIGAGSHRLRPRARRSRPPAPQACRRSTARTRGSATTSASSSRRGARSSTATTANG